MISVIVKLYRNQKMYGIYASLSMLTNFLEGLKDVDYPDNVKQQQIHWIGKSKGAFVRL